MPISALLDGRRNESKTLAEHWAILKMIETTSDRRYEAGVIGAGNHYRVVCARLHVEHELVKAMSNP